MAKKKTVKQEVTKKEANIVYNGNVTIKLVKDGKTLKTVKKHNTGCSELFDFLSECLMGNSVQGKMPKVLMGYYLAGEEPTKTNLGKKVLSTFVPYADIDKIPVGDNYKVEYKFNIPALIVNIDSENSESVNVLALFNMDNANASVPVPSAFIKLDSSKEITPEMVSSGINIIVLWDMQFSNPTSN